jgi:hypothetical protein
MPAKIVLHQAVHNRPEYTKRSIISIGTRTCYPELEWRVSAIACNEETLILLHDLQRTTAFHLQVYPENVGQWKACEDAWRASGAPFLSHIQNDILVPHGWLSALMDVWNHYKTALVAAWHYPLSAVPAPTILSSDGIGLIQGFHIPGTAFILSREIWKKYDSLDIGHAIYGFDPFEARIKKAGLLVGHAYPPVKIYHMDAVDYPFSLRETTYKEYTDAVYYLRHRQKRPPGKYP